MFFIQNKEVFGVFFVGSVSIFHDFSSPSSCGFLAVFFFGGKLTLTWMFKTPSVGREPWSSPHGVFF